MTWNEQVFRYCERAQDGAFWAEPLNALSNAGFLVVAGMGAWRLWRQQRPTPVCERPGDDPMCTVLVALVASIGIGSFLFHTFASRWARLADVVPIGLFMLVYLVVALRIFLRVDWGRIAVAVGLFLAASATAAAITCPTRLVGLTTYAREPCLNGTMSYAPALATLLLVGALLHTRHPAGMSLLVAAGLFALAMLLRWSDKAACPWTMLLGQPRGTHALWHLVNAATLHVLLRAAIDHRFHARDVVRARLGRCL